MKEEGQENMVESQEAPSLARFLVLPLVIFATLTGLGLYHVWSNLEIVNLGYELYEASSRFRQLNEKNRRLRVELTMKRSVSELSQRTEELKLVPPLPSDIVRVVMSEEFEALSAQPIQRDERSSRERRPLAASPVIKGPEQGSEDEGAPN